MKTSNKIVYSQLDALYKSSPTYPIDNDSQLVIFSDLHMGDGGSNDDFTVNSELFIQALTQYQKQNFTLILNGDIEELQRFSLKNIKKQWRKVYVLFDWFQKRQQLLKTIGNHDLALQVLKDDPYHCLEGLKLGYKDNHLFIFHGHQASKRFQKHNKLIGFTLKYFANPLGIKNYSVAHSSTKQYKIEKRAYHHAAYRKIVSVIGHTHRPLFESLHKVERLKYKIEQLCRDYVNADKDETQGIADAIKIHKKELKKYYKEHKDINYQSYVYNTIFHIPCLFNSGCVIGDKGITCLEISKGTIRLVHWFDESMDKKYLHPSGHEPENVPGTPYSRMVINEESLDYVFTRIKLLS